MSDNYYIARRWVVHAFSDHRVVDAFADDRLGRMEAEQRRDELNEEED